jgi:hypothetical protein
MIEDQVASAVPISPRLLPIVPYFVANLAQFGANHTAFCCQYHLGWCKSHRSFHAYHAVFWCQSFCVWCFANLPLPLTREHHHTGKDVTAPAVMGMLQGCKGSTNGMLHLTGQSRERLTTTDILVFACGNACMLVQAPKRCGHTPGKTVVGFDEACSRIQVGDDFNAQ